MSKTNTPSTIGLLVGVAAAIALEAAAHGRAPILLLLGTVVACATTGIAVEQFLNRNNSKTPVPVPEPEQQPEQPGTGISIHAEEETGHVRYVRSERVQDRLPKLRPHDLDVTPINVEVERRPQRG